MLKEGGGKKTPTFKKIQVSGHPHNTVKRGVINDFCVNPSDAM